MEKGVVQLDHLGQNEGVENRGEVEKWEYPI
jgi:hypothetical protein